MGLMNEINIASRDFLYQAVKTSIRIMLSLSQDFDLTAYIQIRKFYERQIVNIYEPINFEHVFWVLKGTVSLRRFF